MKYLLGGFVLLGVLSGCESSRLLRLETEVRQNLYNLNESVLAIAEEIYHLKRKLRVMKRRQ